MNSCSLCTLRLFRIGSSFFKSVGSGIFIKRLQKRVAFYSHGVEGVAAGAEAPALEEAEKLAPGKAGYEVGVPTDKVAVEADRVGVQQEAPGDGAQVHLALSSSHIAEGEAGRWVHKMDDKGAAWCRGDGH